MTMSSSTTSGRSVAILSSRSSPSMYESTWCPAALRIDSITWSSEYASSTTITLPIPELKPPLGTRPRPCETEGGCATDLPSRLAVRRWRYFKENATAARRHGPKSLRRSRSSLESRDNFARSPDTLACEALNDACPTARTLDFRSPRSLAGILNAPVTYGLQAIPERGGRSAAAGDHRRHVPPGRPLPRCRALRRGRRAGRARPQARFRQHRRPPDGRITPRGLPRDGPRQGGVRARADARSRAASRAARAGAHRDGTGGERSLGRAAAPRARSLPRFPRGGRAAGRRHDGRTCPPLTALESGAGRPVRPFARAVGAPRDPDRSFRFHARVRPAPRPAQRRAGNAHRSPPPAGRRPGRTRRPRRAPPRPHRGRRRNDVPPDRRRRDALADVQDRKSTRLNSSHLGI